MTIPTLEAIPRFMISDSLPHFEHFVWNCAKSYIIMYMSKDSDKDAISGYFKTFDWYEFK